MYVLYDVVYGLVPSWWVTWFLSQLKQVTNFLFFFLLRRKGKKMPNLGHHSFVINQRDPIWILSFFFKKNHARPIMELNRNPFSGSGVKLSPAHPSILRFNQILSLLLHDIRARRCRCIEWRSEKSRFIFFQTVTTTVRFFLALNQSTPRDGGGKKRVSGRWAVKLYREDI